MADKPSRALVLYAAGHAALLAPAAAAAAGSNLDAFASRASCGFLTLRSPPAPAATTAPCCDNTQVPRRIAARFLSWRNCLMYTIISTLERMRKLIKKLPKWIHWSLQYPNCLRGGFMGLRSAMVTNCPRVSSFAENLGFHVFRSEDLAAKFGSSSATKEIGVISGAFGLLGFSDGNVQEASEFDLVFMHVAMENTSSKLGKLGMKTDFNRLEKLVGAVIEAVPTGSAIASRIHVSVMLSYGSASDNKDEFSILNSSPMTDSDLNLLRPRQSCTMKAGHTLDDVRLHHPILLAQWQEGVTRVDLVKQFSFEEFMKLGGNLAMLAERFLHEVAFKAWKAPSMEHNSV
ncbi:hypothetical protein PR202_gb06149 [Eleusine coracana subsp. coracana]|uniref:Uncharacterized protein n=1 Tax=Eleusine coracana subsp. coracana TaxID=191504 RepID=A0AAV5E8P4_ELECO|nr:hypothetical protein PR202_gb06149 [Eleusine coracana subsp. coracana]